MSGSKPGAALPVIADQRFLGNFTGAPTTPVATQIVAGTGINLTPGTNSLTIDATGAGLGTVTNVATGNGLTGGPITTSGTVSLATFTTGFFLGNFSGGTAAPVPVQLVAGSGITFSGTTTSLTVTASGASAGMVLISTSTPTGTAVVTFDPIAATYNNLLIVVSGRSTLGVTPGVNVKLTLNNDTGGNYDYHATQLQNATNGSASAAADTSIDAFLIPWSSSQALNLGGGDIIIENYTDTSLFKHCMYRGSTMGATAVGTTWITRHGGGMWRSTASITRLDLTLTAGNWTAGSRVTLYGMT